MVQAGSFISTNRTSGNLGYSVGIRLLQDCDRELNK